MNIKHSGYSLLEILVAMTLASIVLTAAAQSIGSVYFSQKKIQVVQSFATESQFLMERLVQLSRTNTIDYDRFFVEVGPSVDDCPFFEPDQSPDGGITTNNPTERLDLGYETIFFWDTNEDDVLNRNLGGATPGGVTDDCTQAWNGIQETLYLINSSRTLRIAVKETSTDNKIEIEQQLGADTSGDGEADIWNTVGQWDVASSGICEIDDGGGILYEILGDETSQDFCMQAHDWTVVSPDTIEIVNLSFSPSPNRDPFLGFAVNESQVHPNVSFFLETTLRNPEDFGMEASEVPNISLQTTTSSRVFGNIRK